jgi:hypothetical protein
LHATLCLELRQGGKRREGKAGDYARDGGYYIQDARSLHDETGTMMQEGGEQGGRLTALRRLKPRK